MDLLMDVKGLQVCALCLIGEIVHEKIMSQLSLT